MRASTQEEWGGYLVRLAWELDELGFDSVVRLPPGRPPSLEIFIPPGPPRVMSARRGRTSTFVWTRRNRDRGRGDVVQARGLEVAGWIAGAAR